MAKECLVIGQPNAGKTLFMINFVEFLGNFNLQLFMAGPGNPVTKTLSVIQAHRDLVSNEPHKTRYFQSVQVRLPSRKGKKIITITDTGGLSEGIHQDAEVRRSMAQTIAKIRDAKVILHLIDAAALGRTGSMSGLADIDYQLARFAKDTKGYAILANKMDLPGSEKGVRILTETFRDVKVIPISALYKLGFNEVKQYVGKLF